MGDRRGIIKNLFNNPLLFNFVRHILDGGQTRYLIQIIKKFKIKKILDVGCGTGDYCRITDDYYVGIDYNPNFIGYANRRYGSKNKIFIKMDIMHMNLEKRSFDASVIINTIHHFADEDVIKILKSMKKTSKLVVIHDAIPPKYNPISLLLQKMDRGAFMRTLEQQTKLIKKADLKIVEKLIFRSSSGLYKHSIVVCE